MAPVAPSYFDFNGLRALGSDTTVPQRERLDEAARQFASVFTHMLLKSMRDASLSDGAFDSDQSALYQELFDKQIAMELTRGDGVGITRLLVKQLAPAVEAQPPGLADGGLADGARNAADAANSSARAAAMRAAYTQVGQWSEPQEPGKPADNVSTPEPRTE